MSSSLRRGAGLALAAAVLFGVTTPAIARANHGVGPFATAACLYGGAALAAGMLRFTRRRSGGRLTASALPWLAGSAFFGALLAPSLLAWGITRAGPTPASLTLNLEAVATVLLARVLFSEPIGARVGSAIACMLAGGTLLALDVAQRSTPELLGVIAVAAATLAWAIDNSLLRGLADNDALEVVALKGASGGAISLGIALLRAERLPELAQLSALGVCGALGFGVSLHLYLLAQRQIGVARTGSLFALGPFVGAIVSWALGDRSAGIVTLAGAAAFACGVWLHVTERHAHRHMHGTIEHEHLHRHDDGHHGHGHEPSVTGAHTHRHRHEAVEHDHEHAPDLHHGHGHD